MISSCSARCCFRLCTTPIPGRHLDFHPSSRCPRAARIAAHYADCFAWLNLSRINHRKSRLHGRGTVKIETWLILGLIYQRPLAHRNNTLKKSYTHQMLLSIHRRRQCRKAPKGTDPKPDQSHWEQDGLYEVIQRISMARIRPASA
jgi:hypothetical protein